MEDSVEKEAEEEVKERPPQQLDQLGNNKVKRQKTSELPQILQNPMLQSLMLQSPITKKGPVFKMLGLPEMVAEGDPIPISEEMQRKNGLISDLSRFCSELAFITRYQ